MIRPSPSLLLTIIIPLLVWSGPASAASCTASSSGVNFGGYDPFNPADTESAGSVRLTCDASVSATVALSQGGGSITERQMTNGRSQLAYNLYTDPQRTTVWGDGTGGSSTVAIQGDGTDRAIYGAIPAHQQVTAGSYGDAIVLTVSY